MEKPIRNGRSMEPEEALAIDKLDERVFRDTFGKVIAHGKDAKPEDLVRTFTTGATRNLDINKLDYEGFFSPLVLKFVAEYLHSHRVQVDGTIRASDNWQKGIPIDVYMSSLLRHIMDTWLAHDKYTTPEDLKTNLAAVIFNANGYLFELLKKEQNET